MDDNSEQSPPKDPTNEVVPADTMGMCLTLHIYVADYAILSPCISLLKLVSSAMLLVSELGRVVGCA